MQHGKVMEPGTLAETIREISRAHLENGGLLLGQCISAVGWVNGTVPDCQGIIELPMTDVTGAGIAAGIALTGRRPIFVVRFQDFMILNGSMLLNYAAKVKELHGMACPIFIRALASEGIGPVHSGVLHSVFMHFPGLYVCSPMTPGEYREVWKTFQAKDEPFFVSEHREALGNTQEMPDVVHPRADVTIYAVSSPRLHVAEAARRLAEEGIRCNVIHLLWLKPFVADNRLLAPLRSSRMGLVVDSSHEICGASRSIAYELTTASGVPVRALGLMDRTKCLCEPYQNRAPDATRICETVRRMLGRP